MPTFEELARRAQGLTTLTPPMLLAVQWASDRVHELLGKRRVAIYKRNLELSLPGPLTTGTVTIARGATSIQGSVSAQTAWLAVDPSFPDGWFARIASAWYRLAGRVQSGAGVITLLLESPYAEEDAAERSYTIARHYHPLPLNVYQVDETSFVLARTGTPLTFSHGALPTFTSSAGGLPHTIHEVEPAASGARQLHILPHTNQSEMLTYAAYIDPPPFTYASQLPLGLGIHHILPGLMADFYAWGAEAQQDFQVKALMLNEKARCLTRFESAKEHALLHLESSRTTAFTLVKSHQHDWSPGGIHDAYSEIWSRP